MSKTNQKRKRKAVATLRGKKSEAFEKLMARQLDKEGLTGYVREAPFLPDRSFLADFYWPKLRLVLEVDGGVYLTGGRGSHNTGDGYTKNRFRDIEALMHGILTVRYTTGQVADGYARLTFPTIYRRREKDISCQGDL